MYIKIFNYTQTDKNFVALVIICGRLILSN